MFQRCCVVLHSHQQGSSSCSAISPVLLIARALVFLFFILAILIGVYRYTVVVLTCIPPNKRWCWISFFFNFFFIFYFFIYLIYLFFIYILFIFIIYFYYLFIFIYIYYLFIFYFYYFLFFIYFLFIFYYLLIYYLFIYLLFIYLWLCWVFVSMRGLSPVAATGGHSSSRCAGLYRGLSYCGAQAPDAQAH